MWLKGLTCERDLVLYFSETDWHKQACQVHFTNIEYLSFFYKTHAIKTTIYWLQEHLKINSLNKLYPYLLHTAATSADKAFEAAGDNLS